ncbi:hypothetical protein B296_00010667 [Ensete ventricosum]|uniref:Uncharacterized protein n=1 Tax=Ensete ventricosum TaxID=4639 RepID=A0A426XQM6_ENSVE|nr:hypothetical protein B296_00010667 [Ensete ventricosum]
MVYPSAWVAQSSEHQCTSDLLVGPGRVNRRKYPDYWLKLRPNFRQFGNLWHSCGKSSGLLPVISRRAPSELPDPFGESPSELLARSHYIVQTQPDA